MHCENVNKKSHPINCMHIKMREFTLEKPKENSAFESFRLYFSLAAITRSKNIICTRDVAFGRCFAYEMHIFFLSCSMHTD